jgi:N-acetylglucosaminyldiphosphoundecaprenol N-acetyl-beta-D-mannosaminyltransferase
MGSWSVGKASWFMPSTAGKLNVLGVQLDAVDYESAVERIVSAARSRTGLTVSALAVHGVMTGVLDPVHRYRLNHLDLLVPDGQPVRWALNLLHGADLRDRVYGPTLMLELCRRAALEELPIYLYGSRSDVLERLRSNLVAQVPALIIAGGEPSRFRRLGPEERRAVVARIRKSGAALTFVGLGCPRQEVWAYEHREALGMPIVAVGAAFDFHAGTLAQAPRFLQDRGLEWLFRLVQEPRRLWRRYLYLNPLYVALVALQGLHLRQFDPLDFRRPEADVGVG